MSVEPIPSPWAQRFPRSVRLDPGGLLVAAGMLRTLLSRETTVRLFYTGHAMTPALPDGARLEVAARADPRPGDFALVETEGWGDVRRLLARRPDGSWVSAIDVFPAGRDLLSPDRLLGVVVGIQGRPRRGRRAAAVLHRPLARLSATRHWIGRIARAPDFGGGAMASVQRKYSQQVEGYGGILSEVTSAPVGRLLLSRLRPGARILIAGSGAGGEAMTFARAGFEVVGFDFVPEMVEAARRHAAAAGLRIEFLGAEITTLDLGGRRFDGAYLTPMVYAFIPGRGRRIAALRRVGLHLGEGAPVVFSVARLRGARRLAETGILHLRRRRAGREGEFGDWYTTFLTPAGTLDTSFVHYSRHREVLAEIRAAGFAETEWDGGAFFRASGFVP